MYNFDKDDLKELSKRTNRRDFEFNDYIPNSMKVRSNEIDQIPGTGSLMSTNAASNLERTNSETIGNRQFQGSYESFTNQPLTGLSGLKKKRQTLA